jgi:hypothetical protein
LITKLIRCRRCNQVVPNYQGHELARMNSLPGVEWSDADIKAAGDFLKTHFRHPLEELSVIEGSHVAPESRLRKTGVTYLIAVGGERNFLVQRTKPGLDAPAAYELLSGGLKVVNVSLQIQEKDLRRQINSEKNFSPELKIKMKTFINAFRQEVAAIPPENFEGTAGEVEDGETSLAAYGSLDQARWDRIMNRCRNQFTDSERQALRQFVGENKNPPDVLSIEIHRSISVIPLLDIKSAAVRGARKRIEAQGKGESASIGKAEVEKRHL